MISPEVHRQLMEQALEPYEKAAPKTASARRSIQTAIRLINALVLVDGDLNRKTKIEALRCLLTAYHNLRGL